MKLPRFNSKPGDRGASMVELLTGMGLVALFAGLGIRVVGSVVENVRFEKLSGDIRHLNSALAVYQANGGDMKRLTSSHEAIAALQETRSDQERERFAGAASGSLLENRLELVMLSDREIASDRFRCVWNPSSQRFALSKDSVPGVREFRFSSGTPVLEMRNDEGDASVLSYASESTWIWDYVEAPVTYGPGVTEMPLSNPDGSGVPPVSPPPAGPPPVGPPPVSPPPSSGGSGGLALNLGSGSATAQGGIALNLLSNATTSSSGEIAVGVAGIGLKLGGSQGLGLGFEKSEALNPSTVVQQVTTLETGSGSGTTSAVNGLAANLGSGGSQAENGIGANVGEGESSASNGVAGNVGAGSASATNGIGLNLGTGSAKAGSQVP